MRNHHDVGDLRPGSQARSCSNAKAVAPDREETSELHEHVLEVTGDRVLADHELCGDLAVRLPRGDQAKHLGLPRGQPAGEAGRSREQLRRPLGHRARRPVVRTRTPQPAVRAARRPRRRARAEREGVPDPRPAASYGSRSSRHIATGVPEAVDGSRRRLLRRAGRRRRRRGDRLEGRASEPAAIRSGSAARRARRPTSAHRERDVHQRGEEPSPRIRLSRLARERDDGALGGRPPPCLGQAEERQPRLRVEPDLVARVRSDSSAPARLPIRRRISPVS